MKMAPNPQCRPVAGALLLPSLPDCLDGATMPRILRKRLIPERPARLAATHEEDHEPSLLIAPLDGLPFAKKVKLRRRPQLQQIQLVDAYQTPLATPNPLPCIDNAPPSLKRKPAFGLSTPCYQLHPNVFLPDLKRVGGR